jgi:putative ABC transport system permease protein
VLKSLYFGDNEVDLVHMSDVDALAADALGTPIPLHLRYTARRFAIVGTSIDYLDFRGLTPEKGTLPLRLGQVVLGAEAAAELDLGPGDSLVSDQTNLYDIAATYPLKMHVSGVLAATGSPDDRAVFVDIKTAWIIDGLTHGHQDVTKADDSVILERTEKEITTNAAIVEYTEVTADNFDSFHTHAKPEELPLSAIIVLPADAKSATLLKARYNQSPHLRMLEPENVVEELLAMVFKVKELFDAGYVFIVVAMALLIALVMLLSRQIRRREMETMHRIGCGAWTAFQLQAGEFIIILAGGLLLAAGVATVAVRAAPHVTRWL